MKETLESAFMDCAANFPNNRQDEKSIHLRFDLPYWVISVIEELKGVSCMKESKMKQEKLIEIFNRALKHINLLKYALADKEKDLSFLRFSITPRPCHNQSTGEKSGTNVDNSLLLIDKSQNYGDKKFYQCDPWRNQTISPLARGQRTVLEYDPSAITSVPGIFKESIVLKHVGVQSRTDNFTISRELRPDGRYAISLR